MSDFIDALEQELRAASQRRVRLAAARLPRPRARAVTTLTSLRAIPVLLAALIAVGVAVVALTEVKQSPKHLTASPAVPGRQQLIDILAVLRRPQTSTDRSYPKNAVGPAPAIALAGGAPDVSLIRYATTTPWGERLFFVPLKPATAGEIAASVNQFPRRLREQARRDMTRQARRGETLSVFSANGGGGSATAADIEAGKLVWDRRRWPLICGWCNADAADPGGPRRGGEGRVRAAPPASARPVWGAGLQAQPQSRGAGS